MPEPTRPHVLVTQRVPKPALDLLATFAEIDLNPEPDRIWSKEEVIARLPGHDALYCLLTNRVPV